VNRKKLETNVFLLLGGVCLFVGVFLAIGEWTTLQQIEAQGIVGQEFNQDLYQETAEKFRIFTTIAALGGALFLLGSASYIAQTLIEVSD
jgi:uncharacterized membrane protein YgdD (TMEM256/DUF423 family)